MGTLGRSDCIGRFIRSLEKQEHKDIELIIVDQNNDDRVAQLLRLLKSSVNITHLRFDEVGLSKARNYGLKYASGDIVTFPDDDCWYPSDLLTRVEKIFQVNKYLSGVTGKVIDEGGDTISRFAQSPSLLKRNNVWKRATSVAFFLRHETVRIVGKFDESLGVGADTIWQSGEDIDYPIRIVKAGYKLLYDPSIIVYHPSVLKNGYTEKVIKRAFDYGAGIGRVWRKHSFPLWYVSYYFMRALGGVISSLITFNFCKSKYYWNSFLGRWRGWLSKYE
jgi:glycosyltransferase involved in cell wall biosynthesis